MRRWRADCGDCRYSWEFGGFCERNSGGEPIADIRVRSAKLRGITIPANLVPLAIDEFPALFVAAANAEGETVLTGAEELRVKESDRIQAMVDGLQRLGARVKPLSDGIVVNGGVVAVRHPLRRAELHDREDPAREVDAARSAVFVGGVGQRTHGAGERLGLRAGTSGKAGSAWGR